MRDPIARRRVLIVEDETALADAYRRFFATRYEMAFATTGDETLRVSAAFTPHVAVVDLSLPDTDGFEVVRSLRERWPGLPVVITTGFASMAPVVESMGFGPGACLVKPFSLDQLGAAIDAAR